MKNPDLARERARRLGLFGLAKEWERLGAEPWVEKLLGIEEEERARRSLERRVRAARLGNFKPMADFDWSFPKRIDREGIFDCLQLGFLAEAGNVVLVGPNGVGKTTIAANIGHAALLAGHTVLRVTASEMLSDLSMRESASSLSRRMRRYLSPTLLLIDEVGYLSYDDKSGDLFFEVVSRRHQVKSIVLTTNRAFAEWNQVFPHSSCVTALVDRLVHKAEIILIEGESFRAKEARERSEKKARERKKKKTVPKASKGDPA